MAEGTSRREAEAAAVASFDEVGKWARSIADALYGDRFTGIARAVALAGAAAWIGGLIFIVWHPFVMESSVWALVQWTIILVAIAGSFRARCYFPGLIAGIASVATVAAFFLCGASLRSVPGSMHPFMPQDFGILLYSAIPILIHLLFAWWGARPLFPGPQEAKSHDGGVNAGVCHHSDNPHFVNPQLRAGNKLRLSPSDCRKGWRHQPTESADDVFPRLRF